MNGDPTLSPSKTLKLTLKVTKSPTNLADRAEAADTEHGEDNGADQSVFMKSPPTSTNAAIPTPSHHRKPSIFGTATVEEDEQQDDEDPEDGELSDAEDDAAEKDDAANEAGEGAPTNEDKVEDSEAEDVDVAGTTAVFRLRVRTDSA